MCGRYSLTDPDALRRDFPRLTVAEGLRPRYNVAPSQAVTVAFNDGSGATATARWGLVPSWAKPDGSKGPEPINARLETLAHSRLFGPLVKRRRCLLFADGFFEWRREGATKTPYYFRPAARRVFAFAGVWDRRGGETPTCALITGEPNRLVRDVHDRMPVMLDEPAAMRWIATDATDLDRLFADLAPYPAEAMETYPVTRAMNAPSFDAPGAVEPEAVAST